LQNRSTCKIRPDSGLPQNLHDVRCTLLQQVKRGSDGPMWKVLIFGEGVEGRELEVHPDHLFKIYADPDYFESLKNRFWMGGDTLNCFMEIVSQSMG